MQTGQTVNYYQSGGRRTATITAVVGSGKSGYKTLSLNYPEGGVVMVVKDVPHERDAEPGAGFWLEKGAARKPAETEIVGVLEAPAPKKGGKK